MLDCRPEEGLEGFFKDDIESPDIAEFLIDDNGNSMVKILISMDASGNYTIQEW